MHNQASLENQHPNQQNTSLPIQPYNWTYSYITLFKGHSYCMECKPFKGIKLSQSRKSKTSYFPLHPKTMLATVCYAEVVWTFLDIGCLGNPSESIFLLTFVFALHLLDKTNCNKIFIQCYSPTATALLYSIDNASYHDGEKLILCYSKRMKNKFNLTKKLSYNILFSSRLFYKIYLVNSVKIVDERTNK